MVQGAEDVDFGASDYEGCDAAWEPSLSTLPALQRATMADLSGFTNLTVGARVNLPNSAGDNCGVLAFVGATDFAPGLWCGISLDRPTGKHNGTVKGKKLFECGEKYGAVVRPHLVKVGDYPERGLSDLEDSDEEL